MNLTRPLAILAAALLAPLAAAAQNTAVSVMVDGAAVQFDQPPVERAGRVFVPLRGVFERLGASVVYENGQINATAGRHEIALSIGSNTATVDGVQQSLESPPFLIGGRTLVPLRFISQALGASVNFDQNTQTVYVSRGTLAAAPAEPVTPPPAQVPSYAMTPSAPIAMRLMRLVPSRDASVGGMRPEIGATFAEAVDPNSVRVTLDGRNVTEQTYVSPRSFVYDPTFDLPAASHEVEVVGKTPEGEPFHERWSFATSGAPANYLSGLEPPNGTPARLGFTVSAFTRPGSHIRVVATTSETLTDFNEAATGSIRSDTVADEKGYFEARITLESAATGVVDVRIVSTAPDGAVAVKTLRLQR